VSEVIARFNENKVLFIKGEVDEGNKFRFSSNGNLEAVEIIEELDMTEPTFTRNSVAYLSDGTQVAANQPRFEQGKFGKGVMVEEGTTNLYSMDEWEGHGCSWTLSGEYGDLDVYKCKVTSPDTSNNFGFRRYTNKSINSTTTHLLFSFYVKLIGETGDMSGYVRVNYTDGTEEYYSFTNRFTPNVFANFEEYKNKWVRVTVTVELNSSKTPDYISRAIVWRDNAPETAEMDICGIQVEQKPYPTSFTYGTRAAETLTIPTEGVLNPQEGTWEQWVYVTDVTKRQIYGQYPGIFRIPRLSGQHGILVCHASGSSNWVLETRNDDNQTSGANAPDSYTPNGWHLFTATWKNEEAVLYIDGIRRGTISNPRLPSGFTSYAYIGGYSSASYLNTLHDSVRISNRARTDEEILAAYQSNKPLPVDKDTTYKLGFDNSLNPNKNINTIQIDKNRILFIPEFEEGVNF
jgi:hypothetical protein